MKSNRVYKRLFATGLLLLSVGALLGAITKTPDFLRGFMVGLGITLMIGGFVAPRLKKA